MLQVTLNSVNDIPRHDRGIPASITESLRTSYALHARGKNCLISQSKTASKVLRSSRSWACSKFGFAEPEVSMQKAIVCGPAFSFISKSADENAGRQMANW